MNERTKKLKQIKLIRKIVEMQTINFFNKYNNGWHQCRYI